MFCKNCGKELSDGSKFCGGCGNQIGEASNATPIAQVNNSPTITPPTNNEYNNNQVDDGNIDYTAAVAGKRTNAALLAIFCGGCGAHKAYLGEPSAMYLLFCWCAIPSIIALCSGIGLFGMSDKDFYNQYIRGREGKISGSNVIMNIVVGTIVGIIAVIISISMGGIFNI